MEEKVKNMAEKIKTCLNKLDEIYPLADSFKFGITKHGTLTISHCGNTILRYLYNGSGIELECQDCGAKSSVTSSVLILANMSYQEILSFDIYSKLADLEKTVYNNHEKRALELAMERDRDMENVQKAIGKEN